MYITSDKIGTPTGGGLVTYHESRALATLGETLVFDRDKLLSIADKHAQHQEPWCWDGILANHLIDHPNLTPTLAHIYSGTWSATTRLLHQRGCKVSITCAAHDIAISQREHLAAGLSYDYPHLTQPHLWEAYSQAYRECDLLVVPGKAPLRTVLAQGRTKPVLIIPHGCTLPSLITPPPATFTVGYLGSVCAPDKGVKYLLQAWKQLAYPDALLILAGVDSLTDYASHLISTHGGGNIRRWGWVHETADFYNSISLYAQPSSTEGYALEVIEALAHGRPVICSDGAGAADVITPEVGVVVSACNVEALATAIDDWRYQYISKERLADACQNTAKQYTWPLIQARYQEAWRTLLS